MMQPVLDEEERKPRVWGGWATIGLSLAIFAVYFLITFLITVIFTALDIANNPGISPSQLTQHLANNGLLISLVVILSAIAGIIFIIIFIKLRRGFTVTQYLALKRISWRTILVLLGLIVVLFMVSAGIDTFFQKPQDTEFTSQAYLTSVYPVLLWLAVVVFAPIFEECFFRGFLFVGLRQSRIGAVGAVLITSISWAGLHTQYSIYGILTIFVLGIVLGIVRLKTKSLWSTIFIHAVWNFAALLATALTLK